MTIETKFNVDDTVFVIINGRLIETSILSLSVVVYSNIPCITYFLDGVETACTVEDRLFPSKEALIKSL